jgi:hypothetical protein
VKDVFGADQGALGEWQSARSISDPVHHPGPPAPDARKAA